MSKPTLPDIEVAALSYARAREELGDTVRALTDDIERLKRERMRAIRNRVARAATARLTLTQLIASAPELFERPRTHILHGIKCGWQKAKGRIDWDDAERVLRLIERHYSEDQQELLIRTERTPNKEALNKLPAAELRKLAITVTEAGDVIVVKPIDGEVDKLVDALLEDATDEAQEQGA